MSVGGSLIIDCPHCSKPIALEVRSTAATQLPADPQMPKPDRLKPRFASYTPEQIAAYSKHAYGADGRKLQSRAGELWKRAQRTPESKRYAICPLCNERKGANVLSDHLERAHAEQIMQMPASDFLNEQGGATA